MQGGGHLTMPGWNKPQLPHTHSDPTNLASFGHKITLYRFNRGGRAHTIAGGSNRSMGVTPPLTLTTMTIRHSHSAPARRQDCVVLARSCYRNCIFIRQTAVLACPSVSLKPVLMNIIRRRRNNNNNNNTIFV